MISEQNIKAQDRLTEVRKCKGKEVKEKMGCPVLTLQRVRDRGVLLQWMEQEMGGFHSLKLKRRPEQALNSDLTIFRRVERGGRSGIGLN